MSDCCDSTCEIKPGSRKSECPECQQVGLQVSTRTMLHHIKEVWNAGLINEQYFYCHSEECAVVYFTKSGKRFNKLDTRTSIGIKEQDDNALICYCFGINKSVALTDKKAKDFVIRQTKESMCACETANPSGQCCLKDFPKFK